jgi:ATP-dependent DNA helicase RecG
MAHPTVDVLAADSDAGDPDAALRPLYPEVEGVGDRVLRRLIGVALDRHGDSLPDALPDALRSRLRLPTIADALRRVHRPPHDAVPSDFVQFRDPALRRFIFDELLTLQLALAVRRQTTSRRPAEPIGVPEDVGVFADSVLPFSATRAQRRVLGHIADDFRAGRPMHRLLQGDVGSGKTAVAYVAARLAAQAGLQTAIMAPTEVLAQQHHRTLSRWFEAAGLRCALLTAGLSKREQRLMRELTLAGAVHCLVGTHSLLGEGLGFARLGLVVVDEQHRFGVRQRLQLRQKAVLPHLLVMTATPIPRTLAMTAYGDLEVSVLDELPPGRQPIRTSLHRQAVRGDVYQRVCAQLDVGRQAYVVFPLVEESEAVDLADATTSYEWLRSGPFARYRVGLVHGRMGPDAKDAALSAFARGELDVLVSTTVIEVGIDVPNATVMVVEHADRFGLSQLHQLRGRVGRGKHESFCLLLAGERPTDEGLARLKVMTSTQDGFVVAQADLEQRGPGEMLGTRQAGVTDLQLADLVRDADLVEQARVEAVALLERDPALSQPEHATLRRLVWSRWGEKLELAEAG